MTRNLRHEFQKYKKFMASFPFFAIFKANLLTCSHNTIDIDPPPPNVILINCLADFILGSVVNPRCNCIFSFTCVSKNGELCPLFLASSLYCRGIQYFEHTCRLCFVNFRCRTNFRFYNLVMKLNYLIQIIENVEDNASISSSSFFLSFFIFFFFLLLCILELLFIYFLKAF